MNDDRPSRRSLLKGLGTLPVAAAVATTSVQAAPPATSAPPYQPTFFNQAEWAFVTSVCDRLIPHDEHGPGAVELGVPEFLDRHMQTPYAAGDIWYMEGPFLEAAPQFGYQGRLPLRDLLRVGMQAVDQYCAQTADGRRFAQLDGAAQDKLLAALEKGDVKLDGIAARTFFSSLLNEVRYGYFADPKYGGNKDMGAWKMIGYPGPRGDFLDWVEVRDKPYPIGPVDLAGRRS